MAKQKKKVKKKTKKSKKRKKVRVLGKHVKWAVLILAAGLLIYAFGTITADVIEQRWLASKCAEIQDSPDLLYPCRCVPTVKDVNTSDEFESLTASYCTCLCYIGENRTVEIEVRVAK